MSKRKAFLIMSSVLWVLTVLLLAGAVIGLYREGAALRGADPLASVFTRERAADRLRPLLPLVFLCLGMTVVGLISGIRDESPEPESLKPGCPVENKTLRRTRGLRISLLALAVVLILAGVHNGGAWDVFSKAIRICTECIGLG